jgi:hypothetical protein
VESRFKIFIGMTRQNPCAINGVPSKNASFGESRKGARPGTLVSRLFPFPAHQTGRAQLEHPAFRLVSPSPLRDFQQGHQTTTYRWVITRRYVNLQTSDLQAVTQQLVAGSVTARR